MFYPSLSTWAAYVCLLLWTAWGQSHAVMLMVCVPCGGLLPLAASFGFQRGLGGCEAVDQNILPC